MTLRNSALAERLIAMLALDTSVRTRLAASGALRDGYHPEMQAVHEANASQLDGLLQGVWPSRGDVGEDGQEAAWIIVQHAIGRPEFQRRYLAILRAAADAGRANRQHAAMLEDRISILEGRRQRFGTQFDWDEAGQMSPAPIDDPDAVDTRRAPMGLEPLADAIARHRAHALNENARPPADHARRTIEFEAWARTIGWRS
jgi:hypothetical protein